VAGHLVELDLVDLVVALEILQQLANRAKRDWNLRLYRPRWDLPSRV